MKQTKETLKQFFETGDKPTQQQYADLIDSYIDAKQKEGEANRRFVINEKGEVTVTYEQKTAEYSLSDITNNKLSLLKDGVAVKEIDLTPYIGNTTKQTQQLKWEEWNDLALQMPNARATRARWRKKANTLHLEIVTLSMPEKGFLATLPETVKPKNSYYGFGSDNLGNTYGVTVNGLGGIYIHNTATKNCTLLFPLD